jgi:hypothetical protein
MRRPRHALPNTFYFTPTTNNPAYSASSLCLSAQVKRDALGCGLGQRQGPQAFRSIEQNGLRPSISPIAVSLCLIHTRRLTNIARCRCLLKESLVSKG